MEIPKLNFRLKRFHVYEVCNIIIVDADIRYVDGEKIER